MHQTLYTLQNRSKKIYLGQKIAFFKVYSGFMRVIFNSGVAIALKLIIWRFEKGIFRYITLL